MSRGRKRRRGQSSFRSKSQAQMFLDEAPPTQEYGLSAEDLLRLAEKPEVSARSVECTCTALIDAELVTASSLPEIRRNMRGPSRDKVLRILTRALEQANPPARRVGQTWFPVVLEDGTSTWILPRRVRCTISRDADGYLPVTDVASRAWEPSLEQLLDNVAPLLSADIDAAVPLWWKGRVRFDFERPEGGIDELAHFASHSADNSFALACVVALLSASYSLELEPTTVAIGLPPRPTGVLRAYTETAEGALIFRAKASGLLSSIPAVQRVLVAYDDAQLARGLLGSTVEVVGLRSVQDLMAMLLPLDTPFAGCTKRSPVKTNEWIDAFTLRLGSREAFRQRMTKPGILARRIGELRGGILGLTGVGVATSAMAIGRLLVPLEGPDRSPGLYLLILGRDILASAILFACIAVGFFWLATRSAPGRSFLAAYALIGRYRLDRPSSGIPGDAAHGWFRREIEKDPAQHSLKTLMFRGLLGVLAPIAAGAAWMLLPSSLASGPAPLDLDTYLVVTFSLGFVLLVVAMPWFSGVMTKLFLRDVEVRSLIRYGLLLRRFRRAKEREWGHGFLMARRLAVLDRTHRSGVWKSTFWTAGAFVFSLLVVPGFDRQTPGPVWAVVLVILPLTIGNAWPIAALDRSAYRIRERLYASLLVHRWLLIGVPLLAIWYRSFCHHNPALFVELSARIVAMLPPGEASQYAVATALAGWALIVYLAGTAVGAVAYFGYVMHAAHLPPGVLQRLAK